jgi:hypothetical protein
MKQEAPTSKVVSSSQLVIRMLKQTKPFFTGGD